MNHSFELLSSMSPKIKHKLKPGQRQFRRVAGASILALKKNIRRSSTHDRYVPTSNQYLNMVESRSSTTGSYESVKSNSIGDNGSKLTHSPSLTAKTTYNEDDSIIVISDSASSSNSVECEEDCTDSLNCLINVDVKTEPECLLPKEKFDAISSWIAEVNIENKTSSTVYTELSTICGIDNSNDFIQENREHAVNSTFISNGCNKKFNELFVKKNKSKVDDTASVNTDDVVDDSLKNIVIEDSFEIVNQSLRTRLRLTDEVENSNRENEKVPEQRIENDFVIINNQLESTEVSDNSNTDEINAAKVLDEIYGISWRAKKELVLSKTEPRKNIKKPSIKTTAVHSERKPKFSLLYKNPYLDAEKSKSNNLLNTLNESRVKETVKSPWIQRLKILCDSDTNSEKSAPQLTPTKLQFDESSDEEHKKTSKYFKKKTNTRKNSPNKENTNVDGDVRRSNNKVRIVSGSSKSSSEVKRTKNSDERYRSSSTNSSLDNFQHITNRRPVHKCTNDGIISDSDSSNKEVPVSTKTTAKKGPKPTVRKKQQLEIASSTSSEGHVKTKPNRKTDKKVVININSSGSDEEWDKEISKIERKGRPKDGGYSFLASLSESVPIAECDMSARIFRNNFKTYKGQLLKKLFNLYNEKVFDSVLPQDMLIEWNDRMRSSAGFCYCKKITKRSGTVERSARITLSTKVLDRAGRLRDTLIHEMCHAATWIVNCVSDGHGNYWKSWALKAMRTFPELPDIKRCHNYVINTKYTYKCTTCGYSIGRHSKSLDIERYRCGCCHGKFELLINKTNKKGETKSVAATPKKNATGFALFVKDNYGIYKTPDRKHGDVMKMLGQKFQAMKVDFKV